MLSTSPKGDSGWSMDTILEILLSLTQQYQEIENKVEQQGLKIEIHVQEMSQRFEELGTRVNAQAPQLETELNYTEIN